jgi:hypothetical protein
MGGEAAYERAYLGVEGLETPDLAYLICLGLLLALILGPQEIIWVL